MMKDNEFIHGRVLSAEEVTKREHGVISWLGSLPDDFHDTQSERTLDLIATIRDRDKTISELRAMYNEGVSLLLKLRDPQIDETGTRWIDDLLARHLSNTVSE